MVERPAQGSRPDRPRSFYDEARGWVASPAGWISGSSAVQVRDPGRVRVLATAATAQLGGYSPASMRRKISSPIATWPHRSSDTRTIASNATAT